MRSSTITPLCRAKHHPDKRPARLCALIVLVLAACEGSSGPSVYVPPTGPTTVTAPTARACEVDAIDHRTDRTVYTTDSRGGVRSELPGYSILFRCRGGNAETRVVSKARLWVDREYRDDDVRYLIMQSGDEHWLCGDEFCNWAQTIRPEESFQWQGFFTWCTEDGWQRGECSHHEIRLPTHPPD